MISQDSLRKNQLAKIHMAKAQLGLDDDTYRALLMDVTGKDSSAKLTAKQRAAVLERFESKGWKRKSKKHRGEPVSVATEKAPLMSKIRALLADMKLPWAYAAGIMKQQGIKAQRLEWCTNKELHSIVVSLVNRQKKLQNQAESQTDTNV
ncbi:MAG: regulatory protein GemA [Nitrosomonas sp.]|nr:regulatory protein GemA [Nitrosomonas sp.]